VRNDDAATHVSDTDASRETATDQLEAAFTHICRYNK